MGFENGSDFPGAEMEENSDRPRFLREIGEDRLITLDVRLLFANQQELLPNILEAASRTGAGQVLRLFVPFEPVPLYGVLRDEGFLHWSEPPAGPEDPWTIFFYREEGFGEEVAESAGELEEDDLTAIELSGEEGEELPERVSEALEELVYGDVILVRSDREPTVLAALLKERGLGIRTKQNSETVWETRIWRKD